MPSRILLISSNRCEQPYPVFPLGLAHLETCLRRTGHVTRILDCLAHGTTVADTLAEFRPDAVGISLRNVDDVQSVSRETYFGDAVALCQSVRRGCACPIVLGPV